jgi:asparagine synthetase B (glutamine-hydrolysing)
MLLRIDAQQPSDHAPPVEWSRWVSRHRSGWSITGDRTADVEIFLYRGTHSIAVATDLGELLDDLHASGIVPQLNSFAISSLLNHCIVKLPQTEYLDVYFLAMGDVADVQFLDGTPEIEWSIDYPWINTKSSEDREPSTRMLFDLLATATERTMADAGNGGLLMLSSGKDSTAVALALAECGRDDVEAVTFSSGSSDPEPPVAAANCARLGLKHRVVEIPSDPAVVSAALVAFFEASPRVGGDLSQIPYALTAAVVGRRPGHVMLDGSGNDSYMGLVAGRHQESKARFRIRGRRPAELAAKLTKVDSRVNYLARTRAETVLSGRMLRPHEYLLLYPAGVDTGPEWRAESSRTKSLDLVDLWGLVKLRNSDTAGSMLKQRLAATSIGMSAGLPFCDHELADYYFNLPERHRFGRKTGTNKVLFRAMLLEFMEYDADAVGKHYFMFDGPGFIDRNMDFIRSEIDACALWDEPGLSVVHDWLSQIEDRPFLYHAILTIFMVSGWHNHSRYISRSTADVRSMDG